MYASAGSIGVTSVVRSGPAARQADGEWAQGAGRDCLVTAPMLFICRRYLPGKGRGG